MRPLMVARTFKPLSHLTLNIALGSASCTTPSNSSLSPFGSFRSLRSLTCLNPLFSSNSERFEDRLRYLGHRFRSIDSADGSLFFVVGTHRCRGVGVGF